MIVLLRRLMAHMRWADSLTGDALQRNAPDDAESVRLFAHVASVEHLWYARIHERPAEHAIWPSFGLADARSVAATHADLFERLLAGANDSDLARTVPYRNSAGRSFKSSVGDIVTHVAMHGSHHRGQLVRRLRTLGHEPPYIDYIQFTRLDQLQ